MKHAFLVIVFCLIVLVACSTEEMPYKTLADTKPSTPTGNVVGVKTAPSLSTPSCKDSDYGIQFTAVGRVYGTDRDHSPYEMKDVCFGDYLYEYHCDGVTPQVDTHRCTNGCQNGFCV